MFLQNCSISFDKKKFPEYWTSNAFITDHINKSRQYRRRKSAMMLRDSWLSSFAAATGEIHISEVKLNPGSSPDRRKRTKESSKGPLKKIYTQDVYIYCHEMCIDFATCEFVSIERACDKNSPKNILLYMSDKVARRKEQRTHRPLRQDNRWSSSNSIFFEYFRLNHYLFAVPFAASSSSPANFASSRNSRASLQERWTVIVPRYCQCHSISSLSAAFCARRSLPVRAALVPDSDRDDPDFRRSYARERSAGTVGAGARVIRKINLFLRRRRSAAKSCELLFNEVTDRETMKMRCRAVRLVVPSMTTPRRPPWSFTCCAPGWETPRESSDRRGTHPASSRSLSCCWSSARPASPCTDGCNICKAFFFLFIDDCLRRCIIKRDKQN